MITTNLGYPRIGRNRELKRAVESYWRRKIDLVDMLARADDVRRTALREQAGRGIDLIPSNDFTLYDQMLDHAAMFGVVPARFGWSGGPVNIDTYFAMARGTDDAVACEMTKWFNTNYHYIVPEFEGPFRLTENKPLQAVRSARADLEIETKPVIIGPFTFVALGHNRSSHSFADLLMGLVPLYQQVLRELDDAGVAWVQMDEPALVMDRTDDEIQLLADAYGTLADVKGDLHVMLQTYFDDVAPHYPRIVDLPVDGIGLDFVHGRRNLNAMEAHGFPADKVLGVGIVNGRNVWRTDLSAALDLLERIGRHADLEKVHLGPSCSLLHLPISLELELDPSTEPAPSAGSELALSLPKGQALSLPKGSGRGLDPTIKSWLAYANERLDELNWLARAVNAGRDAIATELQENRTILHQRRRSPMTTNPAVQARLANLKPDDFSRSVLALERRTIQQEQLHLPPLPTTTIGSFPQTREVRRVRAEFNRGDISQEDYEAFLHDQFARVIRLQEELGLDVLVHGEFERSDMVDYFAQQLDGMAFIQGWVQSYGTRCVRPPLIYGDVSRPESMTVDVSRYVQGLTDKLVKGMLTGPVTILMWSFPRDDIPREQIADQLALCIRDEAQDLERAGLQIIQIDEPAFREGLPLKHPDWHDYLRWATRAFRLASSGVQPSTQLHTHMCYADFHDIMPAIRDMDADVISIENSRSAGELLETFRDFEYDRDIGPGVYDVHSERVPSAEEMAGLIRRSAQVLDPDLLWVNPDCGLKTRGWDEVIVSLRNLVEAARQARAGLF